MRKRGSLIDFLIFSLQQKEREGQTSAVLGERACVYPEKEREKVLAVKRENVCVCDLVWQRVCVSEGRRGRASE